VKKILPALLAVGLAVSMAGCGGSGVANDVGGAVDMITRAELTAGAANVQQWREQHGTYAGANPGVPGVTLVRADQNGWCLQTSNAHETGPGGALASGPC
jgi:hypothetical protein